MAEIGEQGLRERREAIVTEHIDAENRHDIEATIETFEHPRYEVNGEVSEGEGAVRDLLDELIASASDWHAEPVTLYHADDAVIGEARISGTHDGPFAGIRPSGRRFDYPVVAIFEFDDDRLLCEKVYFDSATFLRQIGVLPEQPATGGDGRDSLEAGQSMDREAIPEFEELLDPLRAAHNRQDAAGFASCFTADGVLRVVATGEVAQGQEEIRATAEGRYRAFPDWTVEPRKLYDCGDVAWLEWTITGTHEGEFKGIPPTGSRIELLGCSLFRFAPDGLVVEEVVSFDSATLLRQVGVLPEPAAG